MNQPVHVHKFAVLVGLEMDPNGHVIPTNCLVLRLKDGVTLVLPRRL